MLRRVRSRLSYANVVSTLALVVAVGLGSAYAASKIQTQDLAKHAVTSKKLAANAVHSKQIKNAAVTTDKIADQAVTTDKIADQAVTTGKLADKAVTTGKIADAAVTNTQLATNSVSGLVQVVDGTITGSDVLENTLTFGCNPQISPFPSGTQGPYTIGGTGFCIFALHPTSATWKEAANDCSNVIPASTLATPAEIQQLESDQGNPIAGTTGIWTAMPSAATAAWTVHVANGGDVSDFASTPIATSSTGPVVCVYQPASKNG